MTKSKKTSKSRQKCDFGMEPKLQFGFIGVLRHMLQNNNTSSHML